MNQYPHLNDTYITEKLKQQLFEISKYPMTVISAPTGYGKTTAMQWWNEYRKRYISESALYKLTIVDDSITGFWGDFCRSIKKDHPKLEEQMLEIGFPDTKRKMLLFLDLWEEELEKQEGELFFLFDDVQIISTEPFISFLMFLAEHIPDHVHMILISRDTVFSTAQMMKLGRTLLNISREILQLGQEEVLDYAKNCGLAISDLEAKELAAFSDGWISFIYLIFCSYADLGKWQFDRGDIDGLIKEVMLDPLSKEEQKFLTVMSVASEFTEEEAIYLWNEENALELLEKLSKKNAFITCDANGVYRYHNLLKQNTIQLFQELAIEEQKAIWIRLGDWYLSQKEYLIAISAYRKAEEWEKLLDTVTFDRGSSFNGMHRESVFEWCENCPKEILCAHPEAILIFALQYFTAGNIPKMLQLNEMLIDVVKKNPKLTKKERDNFLGESEILLGFLKFNNISAMSMHHRKACQLMDRKSYLVNHRNPWVFGSPSILLLYHRQKGLLSEENEEMKDCMPYYYQLTDCHGNGAEDSMQAETYFMQGIFDEAEISYYKGKSAAIKKEQHSILLTAEFTAIRLAFMKGDYQKIQSILNHLLDCIIEARQFVLLPTVDLCHAWIGAMLERKDLVPDWILEENAIDTLMSVSAPAFLVIRNEVLLLMEEWAYLIAEKKEMKQICENRKMVLCGIYIRIQMASAYIRLEKRKPALEELKEALDLAVTDRIYLPFAEHIEYIHGLLEACIEENIYKKEIEEIIRLSEVFVTSKKKILKENFDEIVDCGLSKREMEIAVLASERRSTKEIAAMLNLSENTVKTHLRHIFDKLDITGPARNKRELLEKKIKNYKNNP